MWTSTTLEPGSKERSQTFSSSSVRADDLLGPFEEVGQQPELARRQAEVPAAARGAEPAAVQLHVREAQRPAGGRRAAARRPRARTRATSSSKAKGLVR